MFVTIISQDKEDSVVYGDLEVGRTNAQGEVYPLYKRLGDNVNCLGNYKNKERAIAVVQEIVEQQAELNAAIALANSDCNANNIAGRYAAIKNLSTYYMPEE